MMKASVASNERLEVGTAGPSMSIKSNCRRGCRGCVCGKTECAVM